MRTVRSGCYRVLVGFAFVVLCEPSVADAQALPGLGRQLGTPLPAAPTQAEDEASTDEDSTPSEPQSEAPASPQLQIGYAYYKLSDGYGGGDVHAGTLSIFLRLPVSELRLAAGAEFGARDYSLGGADVVLRGEAEVGFQLTEVLDPFVPYASVVGTFGGVIGERFDTTVVHGFGGGGVALGIELYVFRTLHFGISGSYVRLEMDGAAFDLFRFRLAIGL